jgi:hypothetical protein
MFTTHRRRETTAGPGARREPRSDPTAAVPPGFEAVGEALASGSGTVEACGVLGAALAGDGTSLEEALDGLAATARAVTGREPAHADTRALVVAWGDAVLGRLADRSCGDPLTGLATLEHLRGRVADVYRGGRTSGTPPAGSHALVVVAAGPAPAGAGRDQHLVRALADARLGESTRTVFSGAETVARVAPGRLVVLAERDDRLGRRVGLLRRLLEGGSLRARVWIEGLPPADGTAGRLLDELTRT